MATGGGGGGRTSPMLFRVGYTRRNREKPRSRDLRLPTRDTKLQIGKRANS
jgi:hypothetical protein